MAPWTVACQAPLPMGISRQEYWSGLPFPPPGYLPHPGIEPVSLALAGGFLTAEPPGKHLKYWHPCVLSRFSCVSLFVTPWAEACQAPLFLGFSRQEYWSGLPFPPPGDLPNPGIEPMSPYISCIGKEGSLPLAPPRKHTLLH